MASIIRPSTKKYAEKQERLTLTPRESRKITGFGLNQTYKLLQSGAMPAIRLGKRFFIPKSALLKWLDNAGGALDELR